MPRSLEGQVAHICSDLRSGKRRSDRLGLARQWFGGRRLKSRGRASLARSYLPASGHAAKFPC